MLIIQVILILAVAVGGGMLMRSGADARHQAVRRLLLLAFIAVAIVSALVPSLITAVARFVGVGRGTDLVLYLLFVAFVAFVATTYRRFRAMERQVTVLTRRLALDEVVNPRVGPDAGQSPGEVADDGR